MDYSIYRLHTHAHTMTYAHAAITLTLLLAAAFLMHFMNRYEEDRLGSAALGVHSNCGPLQLCHDMGNPDHGFTSFDHLGGTRRKSGQRRPGPVPARRRPRTRATVSMCPSTQSRRRVINCAQLPSAVGPSSISRAATTCKSRGRPVPPIPSSLRACTDDGADGLCEQQRGRRTAAAALITKTSHMNRTRIRPVPGSSVENCVNVSSPVNVAMHLGRSVHVRPLPGLLGPAAELHPLGLPRV